MCGIAGVLSYQRDVLESIRSMTDALHHRGPDDMGIWQDRDAGIGLGHKRLSIIDISSEGHQPMASSSGRYLIAYNGEIYNFNSLRQLLHNTTPFRGHADTEVLLAAIEQWGLDQTLKKCVGMFAFALWDRQERVLYLVRDRFGEKPLYYGFVGRSFVFASEFKALRCVPGWQGAIDREALSLYMRYSYVPTPRSIYQNISKLTPGSYLKITTHKEITKTVYWSAEVAARQALQTPFSGTFEEAKTQTEALLRQSISEKMISDVPLGALLSGGIDSSLVVALMQKESKKPVQTFSIGFYEKEYNEAKHAKAIAQHLKTTHTELYVTAQDCLNVIPKIPALYDEPFADSSQIPTYLVCQLARRSVTVALSGDGGDELFGGYTRYFRTQALWNKLQMIPTALRKGIFSALCRCPVQMWQTVYNLFMKPFPRRYYIDQFGYKTQKALGAFASAQEGYDLFLHFTSLIYYPEKLVRQGISIDKEKSVIHRALIRELGLIPGMMLLDTTDYLSDDILTKVDRASMGVSLETRVPFLDHRLFQFAWQLPLSHKVHPGAGKHILKQILYQYVPKSLLERPKTGFSIPLEKWLRAELRDWTESLFAEIESQALLNSQWVKKAWRQHLNGQINNSNALWNILMFQAWLTTYH